MFENSEILENELNNSAKKLHNIWEIIAQNNRQSLTGNDYDDLELEIIELFDKISDLYREATTQNIVSNRVSSLTKNDSSEFKASLQYHKKQSLMFLWVLGLLTLISILVVFCIFTFDNNKLFPKNFTDLIKDDDSYKTLIILLLIQLGGKITIIFGLGWLIKFVGTLHSKHSQQAIIYQDRIAGLSTAELIITSSRTSIRDLVLKQMSETYLSDKENSFKTAQENKKENTFAIKELINLLKSNIENFKK
ncbi:MAG: hypothetical protein ACEQSR_10480 [Candidatus Methylacidiphilales bacterium]